MTQEVNNNGDIESQLNAANVENLNYHRKTRFSKRFEKLSKEVLNDTRYETTMNELKCYLTKLDGIDMPTKMKDGGFNGIEITRASERKENCWKKLEKSKYYESAQWINSQLFAKIKMDFEQYVERPLIKNGASKEVILDAVVEKVVKPIFDMINEEGEYDDFLNYTMEDIYGMIYFLTGKCHINWANYDNI